eukprot:SAG22_NODE_13783_length_395_cov_0.692568_1_plen_83_part_10
MPDSTVRKMLRKMSSGLSMKKIPDHAITEREEEDHLGEPEAGTPDTPGYDAHRAEQDSKDLQEIFNNAFDRDSDQQISSSEFV